MKLIKNKFINRKFLIFAVIGITVVSLVLMQILPLIYKDSHAAASFQANYNSGSYDANFSLGSPTGSTDTSFPTIVDGGYGGTKSLQYNYDGTST